MIAFIDDHHQAYGVKPICTVLPIARRLIRGRQTICSKSYAKNIDTTTPAGRMMMQMVGSFAEFEP